MNKQNISKVIKKLINERAPRQYVTRRDFMWFFTLYFAEYIKSEMAEFHEEIFEILQTPKWKLFLLVAFRGSGKSTIITTAYTLWSILGVLKKRYVLVLCQTQGQAKQQMMNIRAALENNQLLQKDLGPFKEESNEWGASTLVFKKYNARITVASVEQAIRGTRHLHHRPDLIVLDDVEDLQSAKTKEGRDKTYNWFKGEVIPAGDKETNVVVIGNVVHEDCLTMRLKQEIKDDWLNGLYRFYPLVDQYGKPLWPGKYPDEESIEEQKRLVGSTSAFDREFLLKAVAAEDQVIPSEWIAYYDNIPEETKGNDFRGTFTGVDLAISQKESADYTSMVTVKVFGWGENIRVYVLPHPVNKRMKYPDIRQKLMDICDDYKSLPYIEQVAFQAALEHDMSYERYKAEGVRLSGDKRTRLSRNSHHIEQARILFPRKGAEALIQQIVYFPNELHDDLMDAFTLVVDQVMLVNRKRRPSISDIFVGGTPRIDPSTGKPDKLFYGDRYEREEIDNTPEYFGW